MSLEKSTESLGYKKSSSLTDQEGESDMGEPPEYRLFGAQSWEERNSERV